MRIRIRKALETNGSKHKPKPRIPQLRKFLKPVEPKAPRPEKPEPSPIHDWLWRCTRCKARRVWGCGIGQPDKMAQITRPLLRCEHCADVTRHTFSALGEIRGIVMPEEKS